jgi:hypothetical protein
MKKPSRTSLHASYTSKALKSVALATSIAAFLVSAQHASAQAINLIVSRQVYDGTASPIIPGTTILPNGTVATASDAYVTAGTTNVWSNETPDASFGVTADILLDNVNPLTGVRSGTYDVTAATAGAQQIVNSFPSKSELSLNLTPDGKSVTFMSYVSGVGVLDASNGNTSAVQDNTNPVGTSNNPLVQRAIGQVSLINGTVGAGSTTQVTAVNAYSGNNGRAAILGNDGNYYVAGNAGNSGWNVEVATTSGSNALTVVSGSGTTPSTYGLVIGQLITGTGIPANATVASVIDGTHFTINTNATATSAGIKSKIAVSAATTNALSANTGIQMIAQGSSGNTTVVGTQLGTPGSANGLQYGFSVTSVGLAADKSGKDDNFRGLTLNPFNNTLYTSKGSGSNGVNSVYQIGSGGLPGTSGASSTTISILSGFSQVSAGGTSTTANPILSPFGLWFAAPNVLYVGDEGSGSTQDASTYAGLEKWINSKADGTGTWSLAYTLQNGLHLGTAYSVPNGPNGELYPTALDPATAGLRNIAGVTNADGTVTVYGVTSTTSANTDQGADPNELVAITDNLSASTLPGAESFNVVEQATYGEVLRGVAAAVPEPASAGMLLTGFGLIAGMRRRSSRKA